MKYFLLILLFASQGLTFGQSSFCLCLLNPEITDKDSRIQFDIFMVRSGDPFKLGTSNLVFTFDDLALQNPTVLSHNLNGSYDVPSLSNPLSNRASLNIVLNSNNNGIDINTSPTLLATVGFDIVNNSIINNGSSNFNWLYTGGTIQTVVFNDLSLPTQLLATMVNGSCLKNLTTSLPADLLGFYSDVVDNEILLKWNTSTEQGLSHYDLLKSDDGSKFKSIAIIQSKNNVTNAEYQHVDKDIKKGVRYFYKLKMVDYDGKISYSDVISEIINDNPSNIAVFPNPIHRNGEIQIVTFNDEIYTLKLYDNNSRLLLEKVFTKEMSVETKDLAKGIYFYTIGNNAGSKNGKIEIIE